MSLDKITVTLYDLLGYLLPGYIVLVTCSVLEASFSKTSFISLSAISHSPIPFAIAAYFLGHACHTVGSSLRAVLQKSRGINAQHDASQPHSVRQRLAAAFRRWLCRLFDDSHLRLNAGLDEKILEAVTTAYDLKGLDRLNRLETHMLADSYVSASGGSPDREILTAREGFYRTSMVAFALLAVALIATLLRHGAKVQSVPGHIVHLTLAATIFVAAASLLMSDLFRRGFVFFNRLKNDHTRLLFLALYAKEKLVRKRAKSPSLWE